MKKTLWPQFERLGEDRVRHLLAIEYYRGRTRFYAEEWLWSKEFPIAQREIRRGANKPAGYGNKRAVVAAGAIAMTAFVAHWSLFE